MAHALPDIKAEYALLNDDCGLIRIEDAALIELAGDDREAWLQGQITNDVDKLTLGGSLRFCILEPTGQMLATCQVWAFLGRYVITTQAACLAAVMNRVEQMVIMEDVTARDLTSEYALISVQGPESTRKLAKEVVLPSLDAGPLRTLEQDGFALRNDRSGRGGWDLWIPKGSEVPDDNWLPEIGADVLDITRLEAGIPAFGSDMNSKTLPPEMGSNFVARHISYKKGCYTGQEVLMRIHSRGHTNRSWVGLKSSLPLQAGNPVSHPLRQDAGTVTSACHSPTYGYIAGAMLRNEVLEGPLTVTTEVGQVQAQIIDMPFLDRS